MGVCFCCVGYVVAFFCEYGPTCSWYDNVHVVCTVSLRHDHVACSYRHVAHGGAHVVAAHHVNVLHHFFIYLLGVASAVA